MASLLALSRAASEEAKHLRKLTVWAHGGSLVLAAAASQAPSPWSHACAVIALLIELIAWVLRYRAGETHQAAERARRAAMLMYAYGTATEPPDAVDLRAEFDKRVDQRAANLEDPNYYACVRPPGVERFVEMFQESAFWSKHLYAQASRIMLWSCGIVFVATMLLFILLAPTDATGVLSVLAQLMVPIIAFFISVDLLGLGLGWSEAAKTADRVDRALQTSHLPSHESLLALFSEYSVATAGVLPIPTFLYRRDHDRLDREWRRRRDGN